MIIDKTKRKLGVIFILTLLVTCSEKKDKELPEYLLETTAYTLANTVSRCSISSQNNSGYFQKNTIPSGAFLTVDRIDAELPQAGSVEIYYPKGTTTNLPLVVLFPGGNVNNSFYSKYAARIAADGYVVYVPNRCTIFFTQYFLKVSSAAGNEVYAFAKTQNTDSTSALFGRLNPEKIGYIGHSLGGVTALYALNGICQFPFCDTGSSYLSQVKVAVLYGAGLTNQLDTSKIKLDDAGKAIPVAFVQGSFDTAFPEKDGRSSYDNYKSIKYFILLDGANHYSLTDVTNPYGSNLEKGTSLLTQSEGIERISAVTLIMLNGYLKSSQTDINKLTTNATGITGITVNSSL